MLIVFDIFFKLGIKVDFFDEFCVRVFDLLFVLGMLGCC